MKESVGCFNSTYIIQLISIKKRIDIHPVEKENNELNNFRPR